MPTVAGGDDRLPAHVVAHLVGLVPVQGVAQPKLAMIIGSPAPGGVPIASDGDAAAPRTTMAPITQATTVFLLMLITNNP